MSRYIVATIRPWNIAAYDAHLSQLPGEWHLISDPEDLTVERIGAIDPRFIFFPHWSWRVPAEIFEQYDCVVFHETDLPYGRGGSPIQNLIVRGHTETVISALKMTAEMDGGDIYLKRPLTLEGTADEIFKRSSLIVADMIEQMTKSEITPTPQVGEVTVFKRRTPDQSEIPQSGMDVKQLYDHIRMLDADGYPHAFLDVGGNRCEFRNPVLRHGKLEAQVEIVKREKDD
ncbi:MAG: hypothetical protein OQK24_01460 [Magnetovibrio sp.]|nr:hypothetical protein [Magnetovibrio sp.]